MRTKSTHMNYQEEVLEEFSVKGGLKLDNRTQKVQLVLLHPSGLQPLKLVLKFAIAKEEQFQYTETPKTLRFGTLSEARRLLVRLYKAYISFGKRTGEINPTNAMALYLKDIETIRYMYGIDKER